MVIKKVNKGKKILIIRFSAIGDILLTTPVLRMLKTQKPEYEIHYLVHQKYAHIIQNNPYIDKIIGWKGGFWSNISLLKKEKYHLILDLHSSLRSALIKMLLFYIPSLTFEKKRIIKKLSVLKIKKKINIQHIVKRYIALLQPLDIQDDERGLDFFFDSHPFKHKTALPKTKFIALVLSATYLTKKLPTKKILSIIALCKYPFILLGGQLEQAQGQEIVEGGKKTNNDIINFCGRLSFQESARVIQAAQLVLSNDTGLGHVAAALKKKQITFWGGTTESLGMYPFRNPNYHALQVKNLACRPCSHIGSNSCKLKKKKQKLSCFYQIPTHQVVEKIATLMQ